MTPKQFMLHYLTSPNPDLAYLRRYWAQPTGIESTVGLLEHLGGFIKRTPTGREAWKDFIQAEAIEILRDEELPRGLYPRGSFQSSTTVVADFFSADARNRQDALLVEHMPFLNNILMGMIPSADLEEETGPSIINPANPIVTGGISSLDEDISGGLTGIDIDVDYVGYEANADRHDARSMHFRRLNNAVRMTACGISEQVHEYLNHIGLSASRWSALSALRSLACKAASDVKAAMKLNDDIPIAPTICIDNIDMEQRVHNVSVGHRSHLFRGTWGYVHVPNKELVGTLVLSDLSLASYHASIEKVKSMTINPSIFLPTPAEEDNDAKVWKAQIARVLHQYIAIPSNPATAIPMSSPVIEQIQAKKPSIHMLKLMDASDNSAEGVGQVFQLILAQSGLSVEEFFGRVQPMDGDLGTVQNFNCLRSQRAPSAYPQDQLNNVLFQLGAAHTLWNIATAIFTHHFGDTNDSKDCGAWQYLQALGFPAEKAIQKKDFSLMIDQMEKIFESMLYYCLRVIMKTERKQVNGEQTVIPTIQWNAIVNECYNRYCTARARKEADARECPKLHNMLVQLHDFSSVVEAKRSMKAGDVGRLMTVWKKWSVMAQSIKKITNYSSYLPRMVVLLTGGLNPSLSKYLRHNLLVTPTGRPDHFVAKDFWLEIQNYRLKYFHNKSGIGTQINRLRDIFSPNILLVR
ncbi:hypothetical protein PGTUg99_003744 [Puccinia graminis f. sp. tritici]|uniref:DUF6589 domain-containing protein n=1 Tax=Puccinia graminis f. sp. tritici TaxID=56615 RepID=A0A5B0RSN7_PUCGR|nr:hypothetical protein PGTUg99_003744 [Puccinia graminis f. sp. tritici]